MRVQDQIGFVPAETAVRSAFAALNGIQSDPFAHRVAGISLLFTQMCDVLNLDPSQLIDASRRRAKHDDTFFKREVKALTDYFQNETT